MTGSRNRLAAIVTLGAALWMADGAVSGQPRAAGQQSAGANATGAPAQQTIRQMHLPPVRPLEDGYLKWRLDPADQAYAAIDGTRLKGYVRQLAAISKQYRDEGHQLWGRLMGTSADAKTADWLADRLRQAGVENVRLQPLDVQPIWMPESWEITASGSGKALSLATAVPASRAVTPSAGIDLELVYAGLGTAADFKGRDVTGKAVLITSIPFPGIWGHSAALNGAVQRAEEQGAAAVLTQVAIPGNIRTYRGGGVGSEKTAAFTLGYRDGEALRALIETSATPARVSIRYSGRMVSGMKTANVWGTLPGMTDEKVILVAHRDGYYEAADDNGTGVAALVGLAEYFAKVPKEKRRRTIEFVGTPGHHGGGAPGVAWMAENKETVFARTALMINLEHTARADSVAFPYGPDGGPMLHRSNQAGAFLWYGTPGTPLQQIVLKACDSFGVATYEQPTARPPGEIGRISDYAPSVQIIEANHFYHTDHETADTVPSTGLAATTRAFAKMIDEVNKLDLGRLRGPAPSAAQP